MCQDTKETPADARCYATGGVACWPLGRALAMPASAGII